MRTVSGLPDLPTELFVIVTNYLDPIDIVRCRLTSKAWYREFTHESLLRDVLVREHGDAQEVRALIEPETGQMMDSLPGDKSGQPDDIWKRTFDRVIARRQALKSGKPRFITKRHLRDKLASALGKQGDVRDFIFPITPWGRYRDVLHPFSSSGERTEEQTPATVPTDLLETEWSYDSGLLVYPVMAEIQVYVLLDIEQDTLSVVPFDTKDRVVRRIRLKNNVLVFEWAEREPYQLNEHERVNRHYVSAFDVRLAKDSFPWLAQWEITLRSEWKLDYLGFPLSAPDCWYSDHSTTHYAVYIWQMNRFAWGGYEPIESLFIWDISEPSNHRPFGDSSGDSHVSGPRLVKKLSYLDLDFLTVRQRDTPFLRKLTLDGSACVYFFEEGCNRERGPHVGHGYDAGRRNRGNVVWERVVGIPVLGHGPCWEDRLGTSMIPSRDWRHSSFRSPQFLAPNRATCWRYRGMGHGIRNQILRDEPSSIKYFVVQHTIGVPEVWVFSDSDSWFTEVDLKDIEWRWKQIHGDERYLIIQSGEEIRILHFDCDFGARKKQGKPLLSRA